MARIVALSRDFPVPGEPGPCPDSRAFDIFAGQGRKLIFCGDGGCQNSFFREIGSNCSPDRQDSAGEIEIRQ